MRADKNRHLPLRGFFESVHDDSGVLVVQVARGGGVDAGEYLKQKLGIGFNETTPDGKFTLKEGECMGACGDAPVLLVNNHRMCSFMSNDKIDGLVAELSGNNTK